jgi:hypothetical protein
VVAHADDKLVKQVRCVVRPWRGFGVVLHRKDGTVLQTKARHGLVVQVRVGDLTPCGLNGGPIHGESVVLAGDLDAHALGVEDGLIGPAVTEGEFVGCSAGGQ